MKPGKNKKSEDAVADPKVLVQVLNVLLESEAEFFIKVEGTSTLPYASCVQSLELDQGQFILKLVRPLPHEMLRGAQFRMLFAAGEQRYESLIEYIGREAYLQYRFDLPIELIYADRRSLKRYPFRPRENAYVIASDGGLPGLGVAGPLVNISLGGLALRVDRALKLDDGMRIPPSTSRFERGMFFPRIRIQDLPRLPLLEVDGRVTHATERGSEVILGFAFRELDEEQARMLGDCLRFRELILKSSGHVSRTDQPEGAQAPGESGTHGSAPGAGSGADAKEAPASAPPHDPLLLLRRKCARLCLFAGGSGLAKRFQDVLWEHGYHLLEVYENLAELATSQEQRTIAIQSDLLLVDLDLAQIGDAEPLAAVRQLERQSEPLGGKTLVILCADLDPIMFLGQSENTRFLPLGNEDEGQWIETLDAFLGLRAEDQS